MIRPIIVFPDPALLSPAGPYHMVTPHMHDTLVADLLDTLDASGGIGLAAIQIGEPRAVFALKLPKDDFEVYFNPRIVRVHGAPEDAKPMMEGCLSFPGIFEAVPRYAEIDVEWDEIRYTPDIYTQQPRSATLTGLRAQAFQHELEHLQGKVFLDVLPKAKEKAQRKLVKWKAKGWIYPKGAR